MILFFLKYLLRFSVWFSDFMPDQIFKLCSRQNSDDFCLKKKSLFTCSRKPTGLRTFLCPTKFYQNPRELCLCTFDLSQFHKIFFKISFAFGYLFKNEIIAKASLTAQALSMNTQIDHVEYLNKFPHFISHFPKFLCTSRQQKAIILFKRRKIMVILYHAFYKVKCICTCCYLIHKIYP